MDLCFPLSIDGTAQADVPFDEDFAKASGQVTVLARNSLRFAFPPGKSGYLVETGNASSFSKGPARTRIALAPGRAFRLEWPAVTKSGEPGATLYLNQYDKAGRRLTFATAPFEEGQIAGLMALRPDAATYSFALRFTGQGTLDFGTMSIVTLQTDVDLDAAIAGDGKVGEYLREKIVRAFAERRYDLAEALCRLLPQASLHRQIYWLQLLIARSHYEEAARFFEQAGLRLKAQPSARGRYLRALTALDRRDDLNATLAAAVASGEAPAVIAGLFPYMQHLDTETRSQAAERILSSKDAAKDMCIAAAQLLLDAGRVDGAALAAEAIDATTAKMRAEVSLLRCNISVQRSDTPAAVRHLSRAFEAFGMEAVTLRELPLAARNLTSQALPVSPFLPRTTVIVSCFNAADSIEAALASLQAQSHANLEILVVDDCSTDDSAALVAAVAALDGRVRLIRQPVNNGTYIARNTALAQATGEFVLAHDADDWAHPRKVERLVRRLMASPDLIGVRGCMARFACDTGAHYRNGYIRADFSSLTFRRLPAMAKAGFFDNVRAGADSEYAYRLQRLFGEDAIGELGDILSVTSYLPRSLSSGGRFHIDLNTGVFSPLRAQYQRAYFTWQEHAQSLFVAFPPVGERPFPVPDEIEP